MALVINTNLSSLNAQRQLNGNSSALSTSLERLSSGLRINSAKDDAAGLAIANRFTSQIRGLDQAARNANDAISFLQVAEGAFSEVTNNMQRMRELAIQAANDGALSQQDKDNIQKEVSQLIAEVDRISETTRFGNQKLFAGATGSIADTDQQQIIEGLKSYWLREAQERVNTYYGLDETASDVDLDLEFTTGAAYAAAIISGSSGGNLVSQSLSINLDFFTPVELPNGIDASGFGDYSDRIIAHEMVHAMMWRNMDLSAVKDAAEVGSGTDADRQIWFTEGAAEFIHGGDSRFEAAGSNAAAIQGMFDDIANDNIAGDVLTTYGGGYGAVAFMHDQLKASGSNGIMDVMDYLSDNSSATLKDALYNVANSAWADNGGSITDADTAIAAFYADLDGAAGDAFAAVLESNLNNGDTGAIGGADADGGTAYTAESIFANVAAYSDNPLTGINFVTPDIATEVSAVATEYQVGAQANETITASVGGVSTEVLGIADIDVSTNAAAAIGYLDDALTYISSTRADLGAVQNRLQSTINNLNSISENVSSSRSRVLDADFAQETGTLVKSQIIQQAAFSVLSQANSQPQAVLSLLA